MQSKGQRGTAAARQLPYHRRRSASLMKMKPIPSHPWPKERRIIFTCAITTILVLYLVLSRQQLIYTPYYVPPLSGPERAGAFNDTVQLVAQP